MTAQRPTGRPVEVYGVGGRNENCNLEGIRMFFSRGGWVDESTAQVIDHKTRPRGLSFVLTIIV